MSRTGSQRERVSGRVHLHRDPRAASHRDRGQRLPRHPESWYSWRHEIDPIAKAGFTACAIEVRGYGGSSRPAEIAAYAMAERVADMADVAAALQPGAPAILIGHD